MEGLAWLCDMSILPVTEKGQAGQCVGRGAHANTQKLLSLVSPMLPCQRGKGSSSGAKTARGSSGSAQLVLQKSYFCAVGLGGTAPAFSETFLKCTIGDNFSLLMTPTGLPLL